MSKVTVAAAEVEARAAAVFRGLGFAAGPADEIAAQLVEADLRGVHSHGVMLMPVYVERLRKGIVGTHAEGDVVLDHGAIAVIDARNGMGQLIGRQAMSLAIEKAHRFGIGAVGVRHSQHFGAAAHFVRMAIEEGCVGMAMANTSPVMPAPGGATGVVGNNPVALGAPAGEELPLLLDMALSQVAGGKIRLASIAGTSIPPDWATDADGVPTTNPDKALHGFFLPMAGPKGFGLAMFVEVLCGPLIGGAWGAGVHRLYFSDEPHDCGHFFMALDVEQFGNGTGFRPETDRMAAAVHGARRAPGVDRLYMPGEIEEENAMRQRESGMELEAEVVANLDHFFSELVEDPTR
jgi:LDH2 family malate/lactate/ureidoglycolate dehydrogenase